MKPESTIEFGWQGLRARIPADWELSGLSGDYTGGYLRLEDGEGMPRLELKWSQAKQKQPDLHKALDEYFRLVRKNFKNKKEIYIKRDVQLVRDPSFSEDREVVGFQWKGSIRAVGVIWYCHVCHRVVIVQVNGHLKENFRSLAVDVIRSIQDHPEGYTNRWSAYGLHAEVPRRYRLDKQKLMSGYLMFSFADGSRKLVIERYGLADVLLSENDLESWFRGTYRKELRGYGFQLDPFERADDRGFQLLGYRTRVTDQIPFGIATLLDKMARRIQFAASAWHCSRSNRIYVVRVIAKREAPETARSVARSIPCHEAP